MENQENLSQENLTKEQAEKELNVKKKAETGFITVLRANLYKSHMIYIRKLGKYRFEYLLEYGGEIYGAYIIIKPDNNSRRKLTDGEISEAAALIYSGAVTTLDTLLGTELSDEDKKVAELFEESREKFENQEEKDGK